MGYGEPLFKMRPAGGLSKRSTPLKAATRNALPSSAQGPLAAACQLGSARHSLTRPLRPCRSLLAPVYP